MSLISVELPLPFVWLLGALALAIVWKLKKLRFKGKRFSVTVKFKKQSLLKI